MDVVVQGRVVARVGTLGSEHEDIDVVDPNLLHLDIGRVRTALESHRDDRVHLGDARLPGRRVLHRREVLGTRQSVHHGRRAVHQRGLRVRAHGFRHRDASRQVQHSIFDRVGHRVSVPPKASALHDNRVRAGSRMPGAAGWLQRE